MTHYCNLGGSMRDTLHIQDLPSFSLANHAANNKEDVRRIITETGAKQVMFHLLSLPRKAIAIDDPRLDGWLNRLFNPKPANRSVRPARVLAVVDDGWLPEIDN